MATKWAKLCGHKNNKAPAYARVCSDHFSSESYQRDLQHELLGLPLRKKLKPNAKPDKNLPKEMKKPVKVVAKKKPPPLKTAVPPLKERKKLNITVPGGFKLKFYRKTNNLSPISVKSKENPPTKTTKINRMNSLKSISPKIIDLSATFVKKQTESPKFKPSVVSTPVKATSKCVKVEKKVPPLVMKTNENKCDLKIVSVKSEVSVNNEDTKSIKEDSSNRVLTSKENVQQPKNNNKANKLPIRSSFRIAKKKSIESLSESFTSHVNSKKDGMGRTESFSDKLRFMAKLHLRFERKQIDLDRFFESMEQKHDFLR